MTGSDESGYSGSSETERDGPYAWLVVLMLLVLYTCGFLDRTILNLMVAPIRADLQISDTQFSYLTGLAFVVIYTLAGLPIGSLVDRWSRRWVMMLGAIFWSLATAACGLASNYAALFASRVGVGIGEATLAPSSYSLISDYFSAEKLSRAMSVYGLGVPIGSGFAMIIGGPLVEWLTHLGPATLPIVGSLAPWKLIFVAVGLPGVALGLIAFFVIREPKRQTFDSKSHQSAAPLNLAAFLIERRSIYLPVFLGTGFYSLFGFAAASWYPAYLSRVWSMPVGTVGLFLGSATLVLGIIGTVVSGTIADCLRSRGIRDAQLRVGIAYAVGLSVCGFLGVILPVKWLALTFVAASTFFIFTWVGSCSAFLQIITPSRLRGRVSASYILLTNLMSMAVGPTAVALLTDRYFENDSKVGWSLAVVAILAPVASVASLQIARRSRWLATED